MEYITGWIAVENGIIFLTDPDNPLINRQISCKDTQFRNVAWLTPNGVDGAVKGYTRDLQDTAPSPDSLKVLELEDKVTHNVFSVAVTSGITGADFATKCNECCGATPSFDKPAIPIPIIEETPCPDIPAGTPLYPFEFAYPQNPHNLKYLLQGSFNGQYATPVPNPAGYANIAAVLAFAQAADPSGWANYAAGGAWSNIPAPVDGVAILKLTSTATQSAIVNISLLAASYCLDIPVSDATIDSIVVDGQTINFPPVTLSRTSPQAAFNAIRPYLTGTFDTVPSGGHNKFQYTGLQLPTDLKNGVTVVASFGAGLCP